MSIAHVPLLPDVLVPRAFLTESTNGQSDGVKLLKDIASKALKLLSNLSSSSDNDKETDDRLLLEAHERRLIAYGVEVLDVECLLAILKTARDRAKRKTSAGAAEVQAPRPLKVPTNIVYEASTPPVTPRAPSGEHHEESVEHHTSISRVSVGSRNPPIKVGTLAAADAGFASVLTDLARSAQRIRANFEIKEIQLQIAKERRRSRELEQRWVVLRIGLEPVDPDASQPGRSAGRGA